jgi:hypothetical protein
MHCILYPMTTTLNPEAATLMANMLKEYIDISDEIYQKILTRVKLHGPGVESILIELDERLRNVEHNPFYTDSNYTVIHES